MKTILTPVDFSAVTEAVVTQAAALARADAGRVILLNIIQPPVITAEYAPYLENVAEIIAVSERSAAKHLARLETKLKAGGIEVEVRQLEGLPVRGILDTAAEVKADCIVMGSHGHTAFYDLLVGSTTHGVLLKAACPVLVVPAAPRKPAKPRK